MKLALFSGSLSFSRHVSAALGSEVSIHALHASVLRLPSEIRSCDVALVHSNSQGEFLPRTIALLHDDGIPVAIAADVPDLKEMLELSTYEIRAYFNSYMADVHYRQMITMVQAGQTWISPPLMTGQPAGNRSAVTYEGHGHGGGTAPATAADNQGAEIDHQLGAWFYGVARQMPGGGLSQMVHDQTNPVSPANNDSWTGRIFGPTVTTGSTWFTVAEHHVRLPEGPDASFAHSSGKVDFVALVYGEDYAPSSPTHQLRVSLLDTSFSAGTTQTAAVAVTGLQLITITGIDASGSSPGESEQILRVEMNSNLNGSQSMFLYGCALYFNA